MLDTRIAKLFKNGASQAVRLPAEFRFEGDEVSTRPGVKSWSAFFDLLHSVSVPDSFMADRPMNVVPQERGVFDDEIE